MALEKNSPPLCVDDLFTAAAVTTLSEIYPQLTIGPLGRVLFEFPMKPETMAALSGYPARAVAPLCDFAAHFRNLRRQMYTLIDGNSSSGNISTWRERE